MNHFKGKQFKKDVIIVAVGYYLRYNLSYREVQDLLYDRGINVCHTTIYRWVQEYSKVLYYLWKKKNRQSFYSWKMDETYIKIKGRWHYLYRAIDADGLTLDIWLRKKWNALRLFGVYWNQGINGNISLRYLEFRAGAFDFQTSQQNQIGLISSRKGVRNSCENI